MKPRNLLLYFSIFFTTCLHAQNSIVVTDIVFQAGQNPCGSMVNGGYDKVPSGGVSAGAIVINGFRFDVGYCAWYVLGIPNIRWIVRNTTNHDACITYSFNYIFKNGTNEEGSNGGDGDIKCQGNKTMHIKAGDVADNSYTGDFYYIPSSNSTPVSMTLTIRTCYDLTQTIANEAQKRKQDSIHRIDSIYAVTIQHRQDSVRQAQQASQLATQKLQIQQQSSVEDAKVQKAKEKHSEDSIKHAYVVEQYQEEKQKEEQEREQFEAETNEDAQLMTNLFSMGGGGTTADYLKNKTFGKFDLNIGLNVLCLPLTVASTTTNSINYTPSNSVDNQEAVTLGLKGGLVFSPIYTHRFGISFPLSGSFGYLPIAGFLSYYYQFGVKVHLGLEHVQLLGEFLKTNGEMIMGNTSTYADTINNYSSTTIETGDAEFSTTTEGVGLRVSFAGDKSYNEFDFLYYLKNNVTDITNNNTSYQYPGIGITYYNHNLITIFGDIFWNYPTIGGVPAGFPAQSSVSQNSYFVEVGVTRDFDWYFGKNPSYQPTKKSASFTLDDGVEMATPISIPNSSNSTELKKILPDYNGGYLSGYLLSGRLLHTKIARKLNQLILELNYSFLLKGNTLSMPYNVSVYQTFQFDRFASVNPGLAYLIFRTKYAKPGLRCWVKAGAIIPITSYISMNDNYYYTSDYKQEQYVFNFNYSTGTFETVRLALKLSKSFTIYSDVGLSQLTLTPATFELNSFMINGVQTIIPDPIKLTNQSNPPFDKYSLNYFGVKLGFNIQIF